jgi:hypothetical protein
MQDIQNVCTHHAIALQCENEPQGTDGLMVSIVGQQGKFGQHFP